MSTSGADEKQDHRYNLRRRAQPRREPGQTAKKRRYEQGPLFDGKPSLEWKKLTDLPPSMVQQIQGMLGGQSALASITTGMANLFRSNPGLQEVQTVRSEFLPARLDARYSTNKVHARTVETDMNGFDRAMALIDQDYLKSVIVDLSYKPLFDFGRPYNAPRFGIKHLTIRGFRPDFFTDHVTPIAKATLPKRLTLDFPLYTSAITDDEEEAQQETIQTRTAQSVCVVSAIEQLVANAAFCHSVRELDIPMLDHEGVLDKAAALVRACVNLEVLRLGHVPGIPTNLIQAIAASKIKSLTMSTAGETYEFDPLYNHTTLERVSFTYGYDDGSDGSVGSAFTSLIKAVKTMRNLTALELEYASGKRVDYYVPLLVPDYDTWWHERLVELKIRGQILPSEILDGSGIYTEYRHADYRTLRTFECNVIDILPGDDYREKAVHFIEGVCKRARLLEYMNVQSERSAYQAHVYDAIAAPLYDVEKKDSRPVGVHLVACTPYGGLDAFPASITKLTLVAPAVGWIGLTVKDVNQLRASNITCLITNRKTYKMLGLSRDKVKFEEMTESVRYPPRKLLDGRPVPTDDMDEEEDEETDEDEFEDDD
jgi:hypothetical protein